MPSYDFRCTECAETFEITRPMSAAGDETCPKCGATATKVFSPVGVAFKGTGFHNTDYRTCPKQDGDSGTAPACANCPSAE